jgi:hypothetical protein
MKIAFTGGGKSRFKPFMSIQNEKTAPRRMPAAMAPSTPLRPTNTHPHDRDKGAV